MKRARRSELFYFAVEEGSSQAVSQLPSLPAGGLFLLGFPLCSFLFGLFLGLTLSRFLLGFALCSLLLSLTFRYFLFSLFLGFFLSSFFLGLTLSYFLFSLFLGFFLGLTLGLFLSSFFLRLALGYLFLSLLLCGFFLSLTLGDFLLGLFLSGLFLRLFPGDFFLCYAAFLRRCFFLCSYFPFLSDFSLRSFFTSLLFGSHAFLRVGYPELSIYNEIKKTSKLLVCKELSKNAARFECISKAKVFRSTE